MSDWPSNERHPHGSDDHGEYRHALDLGRPVDVEVYNPNGDVTVRASERDDAVIRHVKHGRPGSRQYDEAELIIEAHDNRIAIRAELGHGGRWAGVSVDININPFKRGASTRAGSRGIEIATGGDDVRYDVEVELPRRIAESRVTVKTASGNAAIAAIAGPIDVTTASGDVRVRETLGPLTIQTASGDVTVDEVMGKLSTRTASGDARIRAAALDQFALQSVSGDLDVDAILAGTADSRLQTVSGDVRLALGVPPAPDGGEPSAALTFQSVSGDAHVAPPFQSTGRRAWRSGAGTRKVAVKTVSGDLTASLAVREAPARATISDPAPSSPPEPPAAPAPIAMPAPAPVTADSGPPADAPDSDAEQAARLDVLAAVERGELDIEEALRRLDREETPVER